VAERAPRWAARVTLPLGLAGLGLSTYLTVVHYTEPTSLSCPNTGIVNCTRVTTSDQAMLFGHVPVALTGAVFFLGMTLMLLPMAWRATSAVWSAARLIAAVAGMGMVVWLVYAEAVILHTLCLWCTAVHLVMFALFVAVIAATAWGGTSDDDGPEHTDPGPGHVEPATSGASVVRPRRPERPSASGA
jgi:uncharacterized membrane protein